VSETKIQFFAIRGFLICDQIFLNTFVDLIDVTHFLWIKEKKKNF